MQISKGDARQLSNTDCYNHSSLSTKQKTFNGLLEGEAQSQSTFYQITNSITKTEEYLNSTPVLSLCQLTTNCTLDNYANDVTKFSYHHITLPNFKRIGDIQTGNRGPTPSNRTT